MHVQRIDREAAQRWVGNWHYIGKVGNAQVGYFGVSDNGTPLAVILVGNPNNVHGVASKYALGKFKGNAEVTRVVAHPDAPANTASRCIAAVCDTLAAEGWEWLFSYADTGQGHHGGIYQALNAVYVGYSAARPGFMMDGEPLHPRSCVAKFGTQAWKHAPGKPCPGVECPRDDCVGNIAAKEGHDLQKVVDMLAAKHTYILIIAKSKKVRHAIRHALKRYEQPYPKKGEPLAVASGETPGHSSSESRGQRTGTAPRRAAERVAAGIRTISRSNVSAAPAPPAAAASRGTQAPPSVDAGVLTRAREGAMSEPARTVIDLATREPVTGETEPRPSVTASIELVGDRIVCNIALSYDNCIALRTAFGDRLAVGPSLVEWARKNKP